MLECNITPWGFTANYKAMGHQIGREGWIVKNICYVSCLEATICNFDHDPQLWKKKLGYMIHVCTSHKTAILVEPGHI